MRSAEEMLKEYIPLMEKKGELKAQGLPYDMEKKRLRQIELEMIELDDSRVEVLVDSKGIAEQRKELSTDKANSYIKSMIDGMIYLSHNKDLSEEEKIEKIAEIILLSIKVLGPYLPNGYSTIFDELQKDNLGEGGSGFKATNLDECTLLYLGVPADFSKVMQ